MSTEQVGVNGSGRDAKERFVKGNRGEPGNQAANGVAGPSTNGGLTVANGSGRPVVVEDEEYVPCGIGYGTAELILREYREEERRKRKDKL